MEAGLPKQKSGKQHAGCSQSNASKSETSKHQAKSCDDAQRKNRLGNHPRSQIIHPPKHYAFLLDDLVLTKVSRSLSVVHAHTLRQISPSIFACVVWSSSSIVLIDCA